MANGNISRMAHRLAHGNAAYGESRSAIYFYDKLNRLIMLKDLVEYAFDEIFEYDAQGRIVSQRRAENIGNASGGEYIFSGYKSKNGDIRLDYVSKRISKMPTENTHFQMWSRKIENKCYVKPLDIK